MRRKGCLLKRHREATSYFREPWEELRMARKSRLAGASAIGGDIRADRDKNSGVEAITVMLFTVLNENRGL